MKLPKLFTFSPPVLHSLGDAGLPLPSSGARFPALDGLRGLAMLLVMFTHCPIIGYSKSPLGLFGGIAVIVFYTLSAFLLYYPFTDTNRKFSIREFYLRRALRIYPAWIVALAINCLLIYFGLSLQHRHQEINHAYLLFILF